MFQRGRDARALAHAIEYDRGTAELGFDGLILAEIQAPQSVSAERIFDEPLLAMGTKIEAEALGVVVLELAIASFFHFGDHFGNFLKMIGVEIALVNCFRIERGKNFQLRDEPLFI